MVLKHHWIILKRSLEGLIPGNTEQGLRDLHAIRRFPGEIIQGCEGPAVCLQREMGKQKKMQRVKRDRQDPCKGLDDPVGHGSGKNLRTDERQETRIG